MQESSFQQDGSISMDEPLVLQNNVPSAPTDFWHRFRLFRFNFEEYSFNHWYVFLLVGFSTFLFLDILYDVRNKSFDFSDSFEFSLTKFALTDWLFISLLVALALTVLAFNRWRGNIPTTFKLLLVKGRVRSLNQGSDINKEYSYFLEEYQRNLLSNKRYIVITISMVTCLALFFFIALIRYIPASLLGFKEDPLYYLIVWVFWTLLPAIFLGYFFGVGAWVIIITGLSIKNLTTKFELNIQPSHPDQCGGLKVLGDFCFGMALPLLIGATLLGIYGIGGIIYPDLTNRLFIVPVAANIFLFLFTLPLAAVAFFLPLWNIHCEMRRRREKYEDEFAERITKLEKKLHVSLDSGELEEAKFAKEEMEIVQVLHPDKIGYPLWPFDRRIMLTLLSTQIIPSISIIIGLSNQWPKH